MNRKSLIGLVIAALVALVGVGVVTADAKETRTGADDTGLVSKTLGF